MKKTESILSRKQVVTTEAAVAELKTFVEHWTDEEIDQWKVEEKYPQVIKAMEKGLLIIDDKMKPTYSLAYPIKNDKGEDSVTKISFRTRIKPMDLANITEGLDINKKQVEYTLRCFAYITGESQIMLNKLEKFDYKMVEQLSTVFF